MSRPRVIELLLIVGVINIPVKIGRRAWRRCFGLMARRTDIFGVNECFTKEQRRLYLRLARKLDLGQYGTRIGPNPIFWDAKKYRLIDGRQTRIHPAGTSALARRWRGFNAARYVTDVVLASLDHPGLEIAAINTHWSAGGWKVPAMWLRGARRQSKKVVNALRAEHTAAGREVVLLGDFNIVRRIFLTAVRWLRVWGVDKVGIALTAAARLVAHRVLLIKAPTDHKHGVIVRIRLNITPRSAS